LVLSHRLVKGEKNNLNIVEVIHTTSCHANWLNDHVYDMCVWYNSASLPA